MDRIWLKSYPEGVPADIDLNQLPTLAKLIDDSCARFADSVAYVQMGRSLKYS
jgi:long-chain acyl-CoA synthetase